MRRCGGQIGRCAILGIEKHGIYVFAKRLFFNNVIFFGHISGNSSIFAGCNGFKTLLIVSGDGNRT